MRDGSGCLEARRSVIMRGRTGTIPAWGDYSYGNNIFSRRLEHAELMGGHSTATRPTTVPWYTSANGHRMLWEACTSRGSIISDTSEATIVVPRRRNGGINGNGRTPQITHTRFAYSGGGRGGSLCCVTTEAASWVQSWRVRGPRR